jgi:hypothetical protein
MQKFVTLYLSAHQVPHGTVEEHLLDYLSSGWRVVSVCAAGGAGPHAGVGDYKTFDSTSVWVAVVLEKEDGGR